ncbi:peptidase C15 [Anabaena sp. FACHB-1237]|uniref:pyroglutamyl-peptidase I family protein n=1 Tax=Anabaena sp. FACHB-1237 TaxID=2692769 RepID=UPI0016801186|nr:peptidase C15 [Anabaena sp. FACHB-1237]MBD2136540.1 peptidase C15 [Anabaena sp. FACHB-1237]
MGKTILLTYFDLWLSEQVSNSSDDLLLELSKMTPLPDNLIFLHRLPVNSELASSQVIAKINFCQPDYIICCGMAACREYLSVEVIASNSGILTANSIDDNCTTLQTSVDMDKLLQGTKSVEISYDCGKFVCEQLYYLVLDYLRQSQLPIKCVFVHVPRLNDQNLPMILEDFLLIIHNLTLL